MFIGLNGHLEFTTNLEFSNGWTILINLAGCGKYVGYLIVPAYIHHEEFAECSKAEYLRKLKVETAAAKSRGDLVKHFKGSDDEILEIINQVRNRVSPRELEVANKLLSGVIEVFKK